MDLLFETIFATFGAISATLAPSKITVQRLES
jgi:hypothetical protein